MTKTITDTTNNPNYSGPVPVTLMDTSGAPYNASGTSGSTIAVTQATASNLNAQVVGPAASGATQSGNPVKVGGVYNSTQPTVTTGQAVDLQSTARGAQIVATGTDAFNATINAITASLAQANQVPVNNSAPQGKLTLSLSS